MADEGNYSAGCLQESKELSNFASMNVGQVIATLSAGGAIFLVGCGVETPETPATYSNMVTYVSGDSLPGRSVFELQELNDSPVIRITPAWTAPSSLKTGTRLMATYRTDGSEVELLALQQAYTDTVRRADRVRQGSDTLWLQSMWRTGNYLNIDCKLAYTASPRSFTLVLDPATAADSVPTLRVSHWMPDTATVSTDYRRRVYASCHIAELWKSDRCRGVKVTFVDINTGLREMTFRKN